MCLCRRQLRIDIICISTEGRLGLGGCNSVVETGGKRYDGGGGDGGGGAADSAGVVLEDPEVRAVGIGGCSRRYGIDLGIGTPVEIDDGEPTLFDM